MNAIDRQHLIVAAAMITESANALKASETINGKWPRGSVLARLRYHAERVTARNLLRLARKK